MGFDLKMFFEELELMLKEGAETDALLEYVASEKEYAKECGQL